MISVVRMFLSVVLFLALAVLWLPIAAILIAYDIAQQVRALAEAFVSRIG